jgi:hypothetical protein
MAASTCLTCGGHSFEIVLLTPLGQNYKLTLVQCSSCGTPVGALEPGPKLAIASLKAQITSIDDRLTRIAEALSGLAPD